MPPRSAALKRKASAKSGSSSSKSARTTRNRTTRTATTATTATTSTTSTTSTMTTTTTTGAGQHALPGTDEGDSSVLQQSYPPEMTNARAQAYVDGDLPTPMDALAAALDATAAQAAHTAPGAAVVHWFRSDLRLRDNRALARADAQARAAGVPLIGLFVVSAADWAAHGTAAARVDLVLRTLAVLRADLAARGVPLWVEVVGGGGGDGGEAVDGRQRQQQVVEAVLGRLEAWGARCVWANTEYEVDELRRDAALVRQCAADGRAMVVVHDTCVVPPGVLISRSSGRPYAVYTPWFRAWKQYVHEHEDVVDLVDAPAAQARDGLPEDLFACPIPEAPAGKRLSAEAAAQLAQLWPAGEHEALRRLEVFCGPGGPLDGYAARRDVPADEATSRLSPYLSSGALSARTALHTACRRAGTAVLDGGSAGFRSWVSEVAWRDFYRHVLVGWPHVCMHKPFRLAYAGVQWQTGDEADARFAAWAAGRTGYPLVDAAMRQLRAEAWMPNRCRMVVASFLAKDLLVDWRRGERFFLECLVDGDFASNSGGWGYAAGVGVDPQPYFRVFNPVRQSERFDPDGVYIRRWVPELAAAGIAGAAIHEPYAREAADQARAAGYPEPIVQHEAARVAALAAYREGREG